MKRLSQTARSMILICVFLLAVEFCFSYVLIRDSQRVLREQVESRMLDISNAAASMLDGDVLRRLQAEDKDTPEYQTVLKTLSTFEENIELSYIYCVRALEDGRFVFTIDPDPESPGSFGEPVPYTDALYGASLGTPGVDDEAYVDKWGRFYSAYSPVFDSRGQVSGIVAVDFSADWYDNQISKQMRATVTISVMSLLIASFIIILIVTRYRKRFNRLFREMNLVSEGIEMLVREISPGAEPVERQEKMPRGMDEIDILGERIHALQEDLSEQIAWVHAQSYIDGLTGLGNRAAYEEHVHQLMDKISAGTAAFAIAVFDLNGLKEINDRYGHEKGDEAICSAAGKLQAVFREGKPYRIGGDEFAVILEGRCADLAQRLEQLRGEQDGFSISAGCAEFDRETDGDYRQVFNRADKAMYDDKREYYRSHGDRRKR